MDGLDRQKRRKRPGREQGSKKEVEEGNPRMKECEL